jgi:hypothetical protein
VLGEDTDSGVGGEWLTAMATRDKDSGQRLGTKRGTGALHENLGSIDPEEMIEIFDAFCEEVVVAAPGEEEEEEEENSDDLSA